MARDVVDMCRFMKDPEEILDYIENYRNYGESYKKGCKDNKNKVRVIGQIAKIQQSQI